MPLPKPVPRNMLHLRDIQLRGYARHDGLMDIEVLLTDNKTYSYANADRPIQSGETVHEMRARLTVTTQMEIVDVEAAIDASPYYMCAAAAAGMKRLIGLKIGRGFLREAMARIGGVEGCTHLRELIQPLATIAFQSQYSITQHGRTGPQPPLPEPDKGPIPRELDNSCYTYNDASPVVAKLNAAAATG